MVPGVRTGRQGRGRAGDRVEEKSESRGEGMRTPELEAPEGRVAFRKEQALRGLSNQHPSVPLFSARLGAPSAHDAPKPGVGWGGRSRAAARGDWAALGPPPSGSGGGRKLRDATGGSVVCKQCPSARWPRRERPRVGACLELEGFLRRPRDEVVGWGRVALDEPANRRTGSRLGRRNPGL